MKIWALIQNGVVTNTIIYDPTTSNGWTPADTHVEITSLDPQPCTGWTYDGANFAPPTLEGE